MLACLCLLPFSGWAADDMNDSENNRRQIADMQHKLDSLAEAQKEIVGSINEMKAIQARIVSVENAGVVNAQIQAEINRVEDSITKHQAALSEPVAERDKLILDTLVPDVINAPFNDSINAQALEWLGVVDVIGNDELAGRVNLDKALLKNYGAYTESLQQFLNKKKTDLVNMKWAAQNEKWTTKFVNDLKKTSYFKTYDEASEGTIPFLTKAYDKLLELKEKGFENCQEDYENLLNGEPADIESVLKQITLLQGKAGLEISAIESLTQERDSLERLLVVPDSLTYNADIIRLETLKQQIDESQTAKIQKEIEEWTDERDYYITREYFSNLRRKPYNKQRLDDGVAYVKEHVETKYLLDYMDETLGMMNNYPTYATAIADALDGPTRELILKYKGFTKGIDVADWKQKIHAPLTKTAYWPIYEKAKKTNNTNISILYLDEIIKQIEAMEAVGYKDCEDRLNNVIKKLRDCAAGTLPFE